MSREIDNLIYNGEKDGVHNWESISGMHFYWHPDWLHIAEDMTGHKAAVVMDVEDASHHDAAQALSKHLNENPKK
ncbi:hypothetical protein L2725_12940 [Shewanella corallii]|uniref:Uncharacterized protein n=2 Tax=Shewanella TaxID=22 RepID=A0ABT0N963_9GAMM|nr:MULTISPECIES: hypothetical protein [Shewanella]MCL1038308.1 hypothetical protein [Shewanella submarina]MCL2914675.1 hypothetical protein [Shewanella corallii]